VSVIVVAGFHSRRNSAGGLRTESTSGGNRVVPVSNRVDRSRMSIGIPHRDVHSKIARPVAQSSAQSKAIAHHQKKRKSGCHAGLRMARPGLEPGTPPFSVVRARTSRPRNRWKQAALAMARSGAEYRKFLPFRLDSGDGARVISRSAVSVLRARQAEAQTLHLAEDLQEARARQARVPRQGARRRRQRRCHARRASGSRSRSASGLSST
jgi:hypothetical protein